MVAQRTHVLYQDEVKLRGACADPERGEVEEGQIERRC
jgi:hypothetical protein